MIGSRKTDQMDFPWDAVHRVAPKRSSRQAYRALQLHAEMFGTLGMKVASEDAGGIVLAEDAEDGLTLRLGYRVDRKVLAKVYHLRATMEFVPAAANLTPHYRLDLKACVLIGVSRELVAVGSGAAEGRKVTNLLTATGAVDKLEERVDLEGLSVTWSPDEGSYEVVVQPYPGSHVSMVLPPMAHTVKLRASEVSAIYCFFRALYETLR
jgi:hypothetical protein